MGHLSLPSTNSFYKTEAAFFSMHAMVPDFPFSEINLHVLCDWPKLDTCNLHRVQMKYVPAF